MKNLTILNLSMLATIGLAVAGCSSDHTFVKDDGTTDEVKWPAAQEVHFDNTQGTFPNLQGLRQVRDGMTKDQIYELLGRPHYSDGWRPKQWNYLFHFSTPGEGRNGITTCQYKVLFDKNNFARSFYWHAIYEEDGQCPPNFDDRQNFTLLTDSLFAFDKSGINDLQMGGRKNLDQLVQEIKRYQNLRNIRVEGHTDRLGSSEHNLKLSQARADTVKDYLVSQGIPGNLIHSVGLGAANQVVPCKGITSPKLLKDCLLPNRRVEVIVQGSR